MRVWIYWPKLGCMSLVFGLQRELQFFVTDTTIPCPTKEWSRGLKEPQLQQPYQTILRIREKHSGTIHYISFRKERKYECIYILMKIWTSNCNRLDCIDRICQSEGIISPLQKCVTHHATVFQTCLSTNYIWILFRFLKKTLILSHGSEAVSSGLAILRVVTFVLSHTQFKFVSIAELELFLALEQLRNDLNCCLNFRLYGLRFKNTVLDVSFW